MYGIRLDSKCLNYGNAMFISMSALVSFVCFLVVVVGIVNSVLNVHGFCWLYSKYIIFSTTHKHKTQTFLAIALCLTVFEMLFAQIVRDCCGEYTNS